MFVHDRVAVTRSRVTVNGDVGRNDVQRLFETNDAGAKIAMFRKTSCDFMVSTYSVEGCLTGRRRRVFTDEGV